MKMGIGYFVLCTLIFSVTLNIVYFSKSHIVSNETRIFSKLLFVNLVGLIIELFCMYISNTFSPDVLPAIIFTRCYLIYLITYLLYMTLYNYVVCYASLKQEKYDYYIKLKKISYYIYFICFALCLVLPMETARGYAVGMAVNFVYLCSTICIVIWFIPIIKNRKVINIKKFIPLFIFIFMITIVALIQKINPRITLITAMEFLVIFIMYHTIENPDLKAIEEIHKAKTLSDNANEEKTMFLYEMTNNIKSVASDINLSADNILSETNNNKINVQVINDHARNIKNDVAKFNTMTNEVFDISNIDAASMKVYNEKYNIKLILREIIQRYKNKASTKNLNFITNIAGDIPSYLYGDGVGLKKALSILLYNSVKYTNKGYIEFDVDTIIKNNIVRLIITIEDSGKGMTTEELNKVFLKPSSKGKNYNIDNTLYDAKRLITMMNGAIISNSVYGSGTTMKIVLDQKYEEVSNELNDYGNIYGKRRILLIDDNENSEKIFKKIFNNTNVEIDCVKLGKEGLDKIRNREKYDLILLDEEMSPLDGHEVMRRLKKIKNFNTDVILLTKTNKYDYDDEYLNEGFIDYLVKTSKKNLVRNKIDKYLK